MKGVIEALNLTKTVMVGNSLGGWRLIPSAEIHLSPNVGHVVTNSLEYILPFLC